ncbi:MAG: TetR/AcrR family transcriptional regulator [Solirubrobacterales bacterium]
MSNINTIQKRKKGIETRRRVLDVSSALFAINGYEGVTVREIAKEAGIKESSLYNHFKNKAGILETLFDEFIKAVPETRPSLDEIEEMLKIMGPEEVFKNILFYVGKSVCGTLSNISMIINNEKFRNPRAADMYYKYLINEPSGYYENIIRKMIERKMVKPINPRLVAEQYNYVSISLTQEYIMSQYGLADADSVVSYMVRTLNFFCEIIKK